MAEMSFQTVSQNAKALYTALFTPLRHHWNAGFYEETPINSGYADTRANETSAFLIRAVSPHTEHQHHTRDPGGDDTFNHLKNRNKFSEIFL